jgi:preprotein translocase subunit SecG
MIYNILIAILILDAVVLVVAILLQSGKGGGLAASFGGASSSPDAFVGIRQAGTILTRATWWCGGIFLGLSFLLQVMSTRNRAPRSILEDTFGTPAPATAPALPGNTAPAAPAIPLEPAPNATAPASPPAAGGTVPPAATPPVNR